VILHVVGKISFALKCKWIF